MSLIIPPKYKLKLLPETTEMAIKMLKDAFQERLSKTLNLRRVTAPLFVLSLAYCIFWAMGSPGGLPYDRICSPAYSYLLQPFGRRL